MSRTMALDVRYNSWYISLPSFEKQQHEMTKFCVVWRMFSFIFMTVKRYGTVYIRYTNKVILLYCCNLNHHG